MMPSLPKNSLSVLVVDDDYVMQRLIVAILKHAGHSGVVVGNGREALACLGERKFDVVLMDVVMPEMDGMKALATIRSAEAISGRHQRIIMLTGCAESDDAARLKRAGADGYVAKPVDATLLVAELTLVAG